MRHTFRFRFRILNRGKKQHIDQENNETFPYRCDFTLLDFLNTSFFPNTCNTTFVDDQMNYNVNTSLEQINDLPVIVEKPKISLLCNAMHDHFIDISCDK